MVYPTEVKMSKMPKNFDKKKFNINTIGGTVQDSVYVPNQVPSQMTCFHCGQLGHGIKTCIWNEKKA